MADDKTSVDRPHDDIVVTRELRHEDGELAWRIVGSLPGMRWEPVGSVTIEPGPDMLGFEIDGRLRFEPRGAGSMGRALCEVEAELSACARDRYRRDEAASTGEEADRG